MNTEMSMKQDTLTYLKLIKESVDMILRKLTNGTIDLKGKVSGKVKRKAVAKPVGYPERPKNAYMQYANDNRSQITSELIRQYKNLMKYDEVTGKYKTSFVKTDGKKWSIAKESGKRWGILKNSNAPLYQKYIKQFTSQKKQYEVDCDNWKVSNPKEFAEYEEKKKSSKIKKIVVPKSELMNKVIQNKQPTFMSKDMTVNKPPLPKFVLSQPMGDVNQMFGPK